MLILASLGSLFVVVVTADPASGARATESVTKEVPRFANWSQGEAWRVEQPPRQQLSSGGHLVSSTAWQE